LAWNAVFVPEPSTCAMAIAGLACGGYLVRRRREHRQRSRSLTAAVLCLALGVAFLTDGSAHAVTLDWVTVGDPGNAGQTLTYAGTPLTFGAVNYEYRIMSFEWTNSQYVQFLNAIDPDGTNPNAVYNLNMGDNARGGISFDTNASSGSKYAAKTNMGNKPVNFVSWFDAARVSNWLHKGGLVYGSTDSSASAPQNTGAYTLGTGTSGSAPAKNTNALYWVPSENEWYKAAYYRGDGVSADYWLYATQSDVLPKPVTATATGDAQRDTSTDNWANYITGADWNGQDGNVTTVGTNGGPGAYGTFDMSGNIAEWNDWNGLQGPSRGVRGGSFVSDASRMSSGTRVTLFLAEEYGVVGFRLAAVVPEPSTWAMGMGALTFATWGVFWRQIRA
jgi:sulfatase modifying factor 1